MYYKTQGIILRRRDYRENDGLFSIYTKDRGKIEAVTKGVKKIKSKLSPHLDYFAVVDLMIARGRNFDQIAGAVMAKNFSGLKSDLVKIVLGNYCLEVLDDLIKTEHKDERVWELLNEAFEIIEKSPLPPFIPAMKAGAGKGAIVRIFSFKLLAHLGYAPELYNCVICKNKIIPAGNFFSGNEGGLVCGACGKVKMIAGLKISTDAIKVLRLMQKENLKQFMKLKISATLAGEINKIVDSFLAIHQDREIKSQKLLTAFKQ